MAQLVAFLRAINVGGHTVKMADLRQLFEALRFSNVATYIASGNVIFDAPVAKASALEAKIERRLKEKLGYEVATFIRSTLDLGTIAAYNPFPSRDRVGEHSLYVGFTRAAPTDEAQHKLLSFRNDIDDFHVRGREIYWWCRTTVSLSTFTGARLERAIGMPATMRNISTVRKLAALYADVHS